MRGLAALLVLLIVAACGIDGQPIPPEDKDETPEPGITVSGSVSAGLTGGRR